MTPTTLRHAREQNLLPSVTTILKVLDKPALTSWLIEQAVLACMTSPAKDGETIDDFVKRILHTEKQQDSESQKARDLGTNIHAAIESGLNGTPFDNALSPYVLPAISTCEIALGKCLFTEKIVTGQGYAGKVDCAFQNSHTITLVDFKTTKKLPKESYPEHRLQLSAYAQALGNTADVPVVTANLYISTIAPGEIKLCINEDHVSDYMNGFVPALKYWMWLNDYQPITP